MYYHVLTAPVKKYQCSSRYLIRVQILDRPIVRSSKGRKWLSLLRHQSVSYKSSPFKRLREQVLYAEMALAPFGA